MGKNNFSSQTKWKFIQKNQLYLRKSVALLKNQSSGNQPAAVHFSEPVLFRPV